MSAAPSSTYMYTSILLVAYVTHPLYISRSYNRLIAIAISSGDSVDYTLITLPFFFFFLMIRRPPISPLFPYPTLFRSIRLGGVPDVPLGVDPEHLQPPVRVATHVKHRQLVAVFVQLAPTPHPGPIGLLLPGMPDTPLGDRHRPRLTSSRSHTHPHRHQL